MADSHQNLFGKALTLIRATIQRMPSRLDRLLTGLTHAIDRNRLWLKAYVTLALLANLLHSYVGRGQVNLSLWSFITSLGFWKEIAPAVVALLLIHRLLEWGRGAYRSNRRRLFGRLIMVIAVFGSLVATTIPLLPLEDPVKASLHAGAQACGLATVLMILILVFPATTLDPDFARLGMFRRYTIVLEWV